MGEAKRGWRQTWLALPQGIPSHDTFRRVCSLVDPAQFAAGFCAWTREIAPAIAGDVVAIDGKTIRWSHDRGQGRGPLHVVSAWASA